MNIFVLCRSCKLGGGVISSADGTKSGGVNEYKYNKALAPYVVKWLEAAGHKVTLCIAPGKGKLHSLNDEINYFIELENKGDYDLAVSSVLMPLIPKLAVQKRMLIIPKG